MKFLKFNEKLKCNNQFLINLKFIPSFSTLFFPTRYKNFREVFSGRHYKISVEGTKYTLIIKKTEESDISGIQVSAKNKLGSASSRANLNVEGMDLSSFTDQ